MFGVSVRPFAKLCPRTMPRLLCCVRTRGCRRRSWFSAGQFALGGRLTSCGGLQELDLSCNNIGALANLGACGRLTALDLSNNGLCCLARAAQICGGLRRLVLRVRGCRVARPTGAARLSAWHTT